MLHRSMIVTLGGHAAAAGIFSGRFAPGCRPRAG
jgi:hypothetical protein